MVLAEGEAKLLPAQLAAVLSLSLRFRVQGVGFRVAIEGEVVPKKLSVILGFIFAARDWEGADGVPAFPTCENVPASPLASHVVLRPFVYVWHSRGRLDDPQTGHLVWLIVSFLVPGLYRQP